MSMLAPRERAILEEELIFNARDDQESADSRIHVTRDGDSVDIVAPRGARSEIVNSLMFSNPVSYSPYSSTIKAVFGFNDETCRVHSKPARGHREILSTQLTISNPRRYRRNSKSESATVQHITGWDSAEQPPPTSTSHHARWASRKCCPYMCQIAERPKVPDSRCPLGWPKVPDVVPKVPMSLLPCGRKCPARMPRCPKCSA